MSRTFEATDLVNAELDKLAAKHGKAYARAVSSAFISIQMMQAVSSLYLAAKGEGDSAYMTPDEALQRVPVFLAHLLGMAAHKLNDEQRRGVQEDAQRIYDTAVAVATKGDHVLQ